MYDVAIVGGGPAGATLARLIGKNYRVLLVDRRRLLAPAGGAGASKCCGGLVSPAAQKVLANMHLGLPEEVLVGPQVFAVRVMDFDNDLQRDYQRHYINVDREKFDRWLLSLVPSRVDVRDGCVVHGVEADRAGGAIRFTRNGRTYNERARLIVAADGANSSVRRWVSQQSGRPAREPEKYIAVQEWYDVDAPPPYFSAIFDRTVTDFYSWTIPKGRALLVGSALRVGKGAVRRFGLLAGKLRRRGIISGGLRKREGAFIYRPCRSAQICTSMGRVAFVGEAGGWISPSSAEGFSFAFQSAAKLAEALEAGVAGFEQRYAALTRCLKRSVIVKNIRCPLMFSPLLRRMIMRSGLGALPSAARRPAAKVAARPAGAV
ncbi:MAG: FAD-binding protein [Planctomycetota bacterium]|jgi:flavin-dependent dehydrogenase